MTKDAVQYRVESIADLAKIVEFFNTYPLITQKQADFLLFKECYELIINKKHTTKEGLDKIVSLKGAMNEGLTSLMQSNFSHIAVNIRNLITNQMIPSNHWIAGFTSAEGSFYVNLTKSLNHRLDEKVILRFSIGQHNRDSALLKSLVTYLNCGITVEYREAISYIVVKFSDIKDKIIPLFKEYPVMGVKSLDFEDFVKVANLMESKSHLTEEGLKEIKQIKSGMNTNRGLN